ncbi:hypothetical protein [Actinomadura sp. DC4]|uniref:hypothetical protein n=1 Tax=Actinomadura sp. DC4 TaxID=3055069 RepID=UPI0025AF7BDF|nr:hypothetical protein [Actinomadura sp. DC4]MDN3351448.1 hypothetical protein [Actinomadura sp. DC4]
MSPDQQPPPKHNIAMWGAPASGKTTFITALDIALTRRDSEWSIVGADDASTDFLVRATDSLSQERKFFPATQTIDRYHWFLIRQGGADRRRRWRGPSKDTLQIGLELLDPPGGAFALNGAYAGLQEELLDNLTNSQGIVFLFDPIREFESGDAFSSLHGTLARLRQRMRASGGLQGGKLPHHLAVCVTKFDEMRVLHTAEKLGLVTSDPHDRYEFPRVDDGDAMELFRELCDISPTGNAEMVMQALDRDFHPERTRYFVTSSIGFHVDKRTSVFDPDDPQNLIPDSSATVAKGQPEPFRIRGQVHPINVMEPMTWLAECLAARMPVGHGGKR